VCGGPRWKQVKCGPGRIRSSGLKSSAPASARALPGCSCSPSPGGPRGTCDGRLPEPVEVSAYHIVAEALTDAAKHARASTVGVEAEVVGDLLRVTVRDDGAGGADLARGTGLAGLKDRVEALGGRIVLHGPGGAGTSLRAELPLSATSDGVASR
jgi:signal transduction histidine kinase